VVCLLLEQKERRFGSDKIKALMNTLKLPDDQPIQNRLISSAIEKSQSRIEGYNFDIRNHVLKYDEVMTKQREAIYRMRKEILFEKDFTELFKTKRWLKGLWSKRSACGV